MITSHFPTFLVSPGIQSTGYFLPNRVLYQAEPTAMGRIARDSGLRTQRSAGSEDHAIHSTRSWSIPLFDVRNGTQGLVCNVVQHVPRKVPSNGLGRPLTRTADPDSPGAAMIGPRS